MEYKPKVTSRGQPKLRWIDGDDLNKLGIKGWQMVTADRIGQCKLEGARSSRHPKLRWIDVDYLSELGIKKMISRDKKL